MANKTLVPNRRTVLALDFDGVLVDSLPEVFSVALAAFARLEPASGLARRLPAARPGDPVFRRFTELVPLGNGAADFGVSLLAIDQGRPVVDQAGFDALFKARGPEWRREFHHRFYQERDALRRRDRGAWLGLHTPYAAFLNLLRCKSGSRTLAIATAKDRDSVALLLAHFQVADLFDPDLIVDNSAGPEKTVHLERILRRADATPDSLVFVDDKVNHLQRVAPMGVTPVLAAWGYNARRERQAARCAGFPVVTPETAASVLFD